MKALLPLALLTLGAAPVDHPRTYLLSIGGIPLKGPDSINAFSIQTWGVVFNAVCHIPYGWRIKAGNSASPDGEIDGEASQGITWFRKSTPKKFRNLVLVTLYDRVQREDIGTPDKMIPATFKGTATISADDRDVQRKLTYRNITLTPVSRCPIH